MEQPEPEDAAGWVSKIEESVAELSCFADHLDPGQHPGQHPGLESEVAVFEAQLVTFLQVTSSGHYFFYFHLLGPSCFFAPPLCALFSASVLSTLLWRMRPGPCCSSAS